MPSSAAKKSREKLPSNGHATNGSGKRSITEEDVLPNGNGNGNGVACRTTAVFPPVLNLNWELYALKKGVQKNEVLVRALRAYLQSEGYQPDRVPTFDVSYI